MQGVGRHSKVFVQEAAWFARTIRFGQLNTRFRKRCHIEFAVSAIHTGGVSLSWAGGILVFIWVHNYFHWIAEVLTCLWPLLQSGERAEWYFSD